MQMPLYCVITSGGPGCLYVYWTVTHCCPIKNDASQNHQIPTDGSVKDSGSVKFIREFERAPIEGVKWQCMPEWDRKNWRLSTSKSPYQKVWVSIKITIDLQNMGVIYVFSITISALQNQRPWWPWTAITCRVANKWTRKKRSGIVGWTNVLIIVKYGYIFSELYQRLQKAFWQAECSAMKLFVSISVS